MATASDSPQIRSELKDGKAPDDHIFRHLETLDHYLNREPIDDVPSEQTSDISPFI